MAFTITKPAAEAAPRTASSQPVARQTNASAGRSASSNADPHPIFADALITSPTVPARASTRTSFQSTVEDASKGAIDEPTTNIARVTFAQEGSDFDPSLSRDGATLAYASTQHRATSDIYVKSVASRTTTRLTNDPAQDMMPRISPDGSLIAFASDRSGNWDIFVMPITGGKAVQLTQGVEHEIAPSWSPDGTRLVYSRMGSTSGRWEMWVADVASPDVASFIGYGLFPQWCPVAATGANGADRILYQLGRERGRKTFGIWTLDFESGKAGNTTQIASDAENALINPCWSPDGQWIIYAQAPADQHARRQPSAQSERDARSGGNVGTPRDASLFMIAANGESQVRLTTGVGTALSPAWSKGAMGERVYFVSNRDGSDNIWSLDLASAVETAQATTGLRATLANKPAPMPQADDNPPTNPDFANAGEGE
jgi:TolB protein